MKITEVNLTKKQQVEFECIEHSDSRPFLQLRERMVLMKSEDLSSKKVAAQLSSSEQAVNRWGKRYLADGVRGLCNKPGQGAKPIMDSSDESVVIEAIEKDRLSVMKAKERWRQATGKEACKSTFRAFLSALAQDLDV